MPATPVFRPSIVLASHPALQMQVKAWWRPRAAVHLEISASGSIDLAVVGIDQRKALILNRSSVKLASA
jgi:hypothetical protein